MVGSLLRVASRTTGSLLVVVAMASFAAGAARAQQGEPVFEQLTRAVKQDYLSLGVLIQTVADFQIDRTMPGENGFSVANFRWQLRGELDGRFGYFLQTNFAGTPSILDASMYFRASQVLRLDAGQFKAPFSYEFLTPASSIDFVNRAQAVTALAPGRQIGLQVGIDIPNNPLGVRAGVFNGNGTRPNGNDGGALMYAARVSGRSAVGERDAGELVYGANIAYSADDAANFGNGFVTGFSGDRTVLGADIRATIGRSLLAAEIDYAVLDPTVGLNRNPWGGHLTAGHMIRGDTQLLLRFDLFEPDNGLGRSDWIVFGLNVWPTAATEFQVNYIVDTDDAAFDQHRLLVNFQFGF